MGVAISIGSSGSGPASLQGPAIVDGVLVSTAEGCCAACSAAGAACETWGLLRPGPAVCKRQPDPSTGLAGLLLGPEFELREQDRWLGGPEAIQPGTGTAITGAKRTGADIQGDGRVGASYAGRRALEPLCGCASKPRLDLSHAFTGVSQPGCGRLWRQRCQ
jgi:hypothetical protein